MSVELTQIIFAGVMFLAVIVWAISFRKAARLGQGTRTATESWPMARFDEPEPLSDIDVTGIQTVRGSRSEVSRLLGRTLLDSGVPGVFASLFEITERTDERIQIRKTGPLICNQPTGMYFSEAVFDLKRIGPDSVEVHYRLGFERLLKGMRRTALAFIIGIGLPVLLIVGGVVWIYVVNNPNQVVRWQVFQTLQVAHVLWPPFLLTGLFNSGRRHTRTWISNVLRSVELASETSTEFTEDKW